MGTLTGKKGDFVVEMQIQDLVSAIKKDGIDAAQAQADSMIADAEKKAANILAQAQAQADSLVKKAQEDVEILKESAKTTAEHAKRDALLYFKKSVQAEFERLLQADIAKTVNGEALVRLIIAAIGDEAPVHYAAEVAEVTEGLQGELAKQINEGLEIKANPRIRVGFRLTAKDGSGYFDCSDEALEEMLAPFFPELSI